MHAMYFILTLTDSSIVYLQNEKSVVKRTYTVNICALWKGPELRLMSSDFLISSSHNIISVVESSSSISVVLHF